MKDKSLLKKAEGETIFNDKLTAAALNKKATKPKKEKNIQKLAKAFIEDPSEVNFKNLCERINWGLRSYIFKIVNDDDATTEVLSKTLEAIYFKRDQFNPNIAQFSTWMYRIAFNNALKYNQAKYAHGSQVNVDFADLYDSTITSDTDETTNIESYTTSDDSEIVYKEGKYIKYDREKVLTDFYDASVKSIQDLPDNLRVVMYDRLINQKKIDDIAYDNNIPVSSVKNWLRKGKTELQEIIKNNYSDLYTMYMDLVAC